MKDVISVDSLIDKFESWCDCDEYHIHSDSPEDHIEANADPNDGHMDFDDRAFKQALHSLLISKLPDTPENKAVLAEMFGVKG